MLKDYFDKNIKPSVDKLEKDMDAWQFVKLAKKYQYHDGLQCLEKNCMVCEAIGTIVNGQDQIAEAEYQRNNDHALDSMPF